MQQTAAMNPMMLRILRLARAVSTLRLTRLFTMFRELRLLVNSVMGCMRSLGLSLFMLFAFILLCSTLLTIGAHGCLNTTSQQEVDDVAKAFGTLSRSCITLYMAICGGMDWGDNYHLLAVAGWQYQLVYIGYVTFTVFGFVNVFTGVFVEHAMQASGKDRELQIKNQIENDNHNLRELQKVFAELDFNNSGKLSLEEFESYLTDERAQAYFEAVKLDVSEVGRLFALLDNDNSGSVDIEEFIEGCQRLKGESRALDIKVALLEIERLQCDVQHYAELISEEIKQLGARS